MKKTNIMMAPLFGAVIMLLSVGAVGELFASLFAKLKSSEKTATEQSHQRATQLR